MFEPFEGIGTEQYQGRMTTAQVEPFCGTELRLSLLPLYTALPLTEISEEGMELVYSMTWTQWPHYCFLQYSTDLTHHHSHCPSVEAATAYVPYKERLFSGQTQPPYH